VQDEDGKPLDSAKIAFGGWFAGGHWRSLDGSNPAACDYLEKTFKMMRENYGVTYFKLDANYWGAIHGGKHFNPNSTRIEAYRRGMEAVVRGAGPGAVILGCNAPMWPSLGLVNAMRTGNDLLRSFDSFRNTARENLLRGWQNGRLWVLDPDCVLLAGDWEPKKDQPKQPIPEAIRLLHASVVHAAGGLVLSGDKIPDLGPEQKAILKKLTPPTGQTARFENNKFEAGVTDLGDRQYFYAFNWGNAPADRAFKLKQRSRLKDFWTSEDLGIHEGTYVLKAIPGQSAKLLVAVPE
jgi:alpha-galactosidase